LLTAGKLFVGNFVLSSDYYAADATVVCVMLKFIKAILLLCLLPPLLWLAIIVLNVSLPLTALKTPLSAAASYALGRNVSFDGEIILAPTLVPTLEIIEVSISNPQGREGQLLQLGRVYLKLDLLSLFMRDIIIEEFLAQQVSLRLEVGADGVENWLLNPPAELAADAEGDVRVDMGEDSDWIVTADIRNVTFEEITLSYTDAVRNSKFLFELDHLEGRMRWEEDILLDGSGYYQGQPWQLVVRAGGIRDLLQGKTGFELTVDAELSGLELGWHMELLAQGQETELSLKGPSLSALSPIAEVALPEWGPYELSGIVTYVEDSYALHDFKVRVGESRMDGSLKLRMQNDIPHLEVDLRSKRFQINDFDQAQDAQTTTVEADATEEKIPETAVTDSEPVEIEDLLSLDVLEKFQFGLNLAFDEILSGKDFLGGGYLRARAGGDRVSVEALHIHLPAGDIDLEGNVVVAEAGYQLALKLDVENFDYGVLARRQDPETDLKGQFFLKVDLESSTPHLEDAMAHGNGVLNFAVWPEEFRSGVIDLWAVGLLSAALNQFESKSVINCVVARFELDNGVMTERALMMDTSEIRVVGDAVIDFPKETVDIYMLPGSKKPQFISAATPVQLKGSFEDFEPIIKKSDIAYSVIRSGFNIVLLGVPLLFHKTLDSDGSEACRRAMTEDFRLDRKRS
jgi:uncharacterized protein involved in outer membrane biogenesis